MRDFKRLQIWQRSHQLALDIYKSTKSVPRSEQFGLRRQIRRCAVSIPSNIAEGCGKDSTGEFARYLRIAMGSASELEYQIILSRDLEYITIESFSKLNEEAIQVKKMLVAYTKRVASSN
jgi:four helix bundle protein